jgi:diguanylate cyclase (GGDEF)-like protein
MIISLYFQTRKFRKQINGKIMQAIFLFMLIPIIAGVIQMLSYGLLIIWPAFIFASMIAYFHIERDSILRDPLTGLTTREQFENRAHYLMNKKINFYVIMIDMNQFKKINDLFGHSEGDKALIISTSILKQNVKTYDLVCRYGGDEFLVLIETASENEIIKINQRIHDEFDKFNHKNIKNYDLTISHGYAK